MPENVPSLIKWTGSKRAQAKKICELIPDHSRYYEPFLGSGALMYLLGKPGSVGGDIYSPLVEFWKLVRDNPLSLVDNYRTQWNLLQENTPDYFYQVRERFNDTQRPEDLNFLMRTCINGIVRFNGKGKFNASFHLTRKGMNPERFKAIVDLWTKKLQGIDFRCMDYEETISSAEARDFVYLDPPYAGTTTQRYIQSLNMERFLAVLEWMNMKSVKWVLSFDGSRGGTVYDHEIPKELYRRKKLIDCGHSRLRLVLSKGVQEKVQESLYLNY